MNKKIRAIIKLYSYFSKDADSSEKIKAICNLTQAITAEMQKRAIGIPCNKLRNKDKRRRRINITDDDVWLSTEGGEHFLLGEGGEIKAGFGGKFTGQKPGQIWGGAKHRLKTQRQSVKMSQRKLSRSKQPLL